MPEFSEQYHFDPLESAAGREQAVARDALLREATGARSEILSRPTLTRAESTAEARPPTSAVQAWDVAFVSSGDLTRLAADTLAAVRAMPRPQIDFSPPAEPLQPQRRGRPASAPEPETDQRQEVRPATTPEPPPERRPPAEILEPWQEVRPPAAGGGAMESFRRALERARSGGRPVSVLHYGASHVAGGVEPRALDELLEQHAPVDYHTRAKVGVSALYPLQHEQSWLDQPIAAANPDVVIIAFGNNEAAGRIDRKSYARSYEQLILKVREKAPNASIVLVGPTDGCSIRGPNKGKLLPGLDQVIEVQKSVARKHGLVYLDSREAMGGPGAIYRWREARLADSDLLHLTKEGYKSYARLIYNHLIAHMND